MSNQESNQPLATEYDAEAVDIIIIGAGLAGTCLALALAKLNLRVLLVEQYPVAHTQQPSFDDRAIAVNLASIQFLKWAGLWSSIVQSTQPIESIHISNKGHLGFSRLHSKNFALPAFGHVVENRVVGIVGHQLLENHPNIQLACPANIKSIATNQSGQPIEVVLENALEEDSENNSESLTRTIRARWLIAADGINSKVRQLCGDQVVKTDYKTKAIIANIATQEPHKNKAFERFTESGPLAFLPMTENRVSVVWAVTQKDSEQLMGYDNGQFISALQNAFGFRLGHITQAGQRQSYPLVQSVNQNHANGRVLYVANAAQALHPIAGQGFNLGLRDIAQLTDCIINITKYGLDDDLLAAQYSNLRQQDQNQLVETTNGLLRLFSNEYPLLTESRNAALNLFDLCRFSQKAAIDYFTGANGNLPAWLWQEQANVYS
jgi:2-octaprenyl-6-methoxyphenol hydroxylase